MIQLDGMLRRAHLLEDTDAPTWLVTQNASGRIVEVQALPGNTNLMRLFLKQMFRYRDAGWLLSEYSALGSSFVAAREHDQERLVYVTLDDPATQETPAVPPASWSSAYFSETVTPASTLKPGAGSKKRPLPSPTMTEPT
jgi:hypothetical protein